MGEPVHIELSRDEALVLFAFLQRFDDQDTLAISDQAEERALWNLQTLFETRLKELWQSDYKDRLLAARDRLRDPTN